MKVFDNREDIVNALKASQTNIHKHMLAYYSSVLGGIITGRTLYLLVDPTFMTMPIDDKSITRAFCVYDIVHIRNKLLYRVFLSINCRLMRLSILFTIQLLLLSYSPLLLRVKLSTL